MNVPSKDFGEKVGVHVQVRGKIANLEPGTSSSVSAYDGALPKLVTRSNVRPSRTVRISPWTT